MLPILNGTTNYTTKIFYFELFKLCKKSHKIHISAYKCDGKLLNVNTQKCITIPFTLKKQATHHSFSQPRGWAPTHTPLQYCMMLIL